MSEEIKYEPVFGPQELFDGAMPDVVFVSKNDETGEMFQYTSIIIALRDLVRYQGYADFIAAMRRIIKTPVWNAEDQKAGRLPEVGCEAKCKDTGKIHEIIRVKGGMVTWWDNDYVRGFSMFEPEFMSRFCPIETTAEKAQRLENEWVIQQLNADILPILTEKQWRELHRSMRSGELKAPGGVMHHDLKTESCYFSAVLDGRKRFAIRFNDDRGFQAGDTFTKHEIAKHNGIETGRTINGVITYVTNYFQRDGYVVFGFKLDGE